MALVKCKECGEQVSTKAKSCPKCGAKAPQKTSLFTWFVLIFIAFVVYGAFRMPSTGTNTGSTRQLQPSKSNVQQTSTSTATPAPPSKPAGAWHYFESKDEMSGEATGFIVSESKNVLRGWLETGHIIFAYTCGKGFYAKANDLGFTLDDLDCDQYSCNRTHYSRVKFDEGQPSDIQFSVWESNNDGMSLQAKSGYPPKDMEAFLMSSMKAGKTMYLEVELFNTKGAKQIAEFDLTGFTSALSQCK